MLEWGLTGTGQVWHDWPQGMLEEWLGESATGGGHVEQGAISGRRMVGDRIGCNRLSTRPCHARDAPARNQTAEDGLTCWCTVVFPSSVLIMVK